MFDQGACSKVAGNCRMQITDTWTTRELEGITLLLRQNSRSAGNSSPTEEDRRKRAVSGIAATSCYRRHPGNCRHH